MGKFLHAKTVLELHEEKPRETSDLCHRTSLAGSRESFFDCRRCARADRDAKIMIVDDESINIMVVEEIFRRCRLPAISLPPATPRQILPPWIKKTPTSCCWIS